jgi:hypothetical protein
MILDLQKAFSHIQFFDETHQYVNTTNGEILPSVTGHIKKFQPEFNEKYWLGEKAKQRGITTEELKAEWVWAAKIGVEMGSALHMFLEQKIQRRHTVPVLPDYLDSTKYTTLQKMAEQYVEDVKEPVVACEFVMCCPDDKLAGMCDSLLMGKTGLIIRDYKTGQMKDSYGKFHSKPYNKLPASSEGKYALQLNHYRHFLESRGFPVESMDLVWFNENNNGYKLIPVEKIEI